MAVPLGGVVCLARSCSSPRVCSQEGSRAHQAQVSQEGTSCPPLWTVMPWVKTWATGTA